MAKLAVAISEYPPLIMGKKGNYFGFEIELWEMIARDNGWDFEFVEKSFYETLLAVSEKKVDIGLAGISISEEREKIMDFSHPTLNSGLLILTSKNRNKISLGSTMKSFWISGKSLMLQFLLVTIVILLFGILLYFVERGSGTFSKNFFPGIFESLWLVMSSITTVGFGDFVPHTWGGRAIILIEMVIGIAVFGIFIAELTSFIATKKIKSDISNFNDLAGKIVATAKRTTSVKTLQAIGAKVVVVDHIKKAYAKLDKGVVDAVVYDAPGLIHYVENEGKEKFEIVGDVFEKQSYSIALQSESPLREKINLSILKLRESGHYDILYKKWFGEETQME